MIIEELPTQQEIDSQSKEVTAAEDQVSDLKKNGGRQDHDEDNRLSVFSNAQDNKRISIEKSTDVPLNRTSLAENSRYLQDNRSSSFNIA